MFLAYNFQSVYNLPTEQMAKFLWQIHHHYNKRKNPFHNLNHGITVMHGCYYFSKIKPMSEILNLLQKFSLILGGLCHDLDHRATTNIFLINTGDKLAIRYLEKSVLENHHAAKTFKILGNPECDILKNFDKEQHGQIKKSMVHNILATDNKEHFVQLGQFEEKMNQNLEGAQPFSMIMYWIWNREGRRPAAAEWDIDSRCGLLRVSEAIRRIAAVEHAGEQ